MNYELCKRLKDAGFPQQSETGATQVWCFIKENNWINKKTGNLEIRREHWKKIWLYEPIKGLYKNDWYRIPTLSELIEACGDKFIHLKKVPGVFFGVAWRWEAIANLEIPREKHHLIGVGRTPEEAVAELLIMIKKRNTLQKE